MNILSQATADFLSRHPDDDPIKLLLQQGRYPDVDMRMVAQQLEGRRQAQEKWPSLCKREGYLFPPKINREQSSSEATALYKASLVSQGETLADLTGGMGIDSLFFAQKVSRVDYCEMDPDVFELSRHNFQALKADNISCHLGDSIAWLETQKEPHDVIFIDPARRDANGHKVQAFEDCTPNLLMHLDLLRNHCRRLIVKASPMIDITLGINQLKEVSQVHIIAVKGECKEVLFVVEPTVSPCQYYCIDIQPDTTHLLSFTPEEEQNASLMTASQIKHYLYEPHAALMKGGALRILCSKYGVEKLGRNSHLYTSDALVSDFPGRIFEVETTLSVNSKEINRLLPQRKVHLLCKNYPFTTALLQKKLRLIEGGHQHLICTRLGDSPIGILCHKI